jgi:hypothetical protein
MRLEKTSYLLFIFRITVWTTSTLKTYTWTLTYSVICVYVCVLLNYISKEKTTSMTPVMEIKENVNENCSLASHIRGSDVNIFEMPHEKIRSPETTIYSI